MTATVPAAPALSKNTTPTSSSNGISHNHSNNAAQVTTVAPPSSSSHIKEDVGATVAERMNALKKEAESTAIKPSSAAVNETNTSSSVIASVVASAAAGPASPTHATEKQEEVPQNVGASLAERMNALKNNSESAVSSAPTTDDEKTSSSGNTLADRMNALKAASSRTDEEKSPKELLAIIKQKDKQIEQLTRELEVIFFLKIRGDLKI